MENKKLHLLLADDDVDDCDFFKDAVDEIPEAIDLTVLNNGVELMDFLLDESEDYPQLIFLDLNMPKKSGMECIMEIKAIDRLADIPIIIYSTSLDQTVVHNLYAMGAHYYIQKPAEFASIKNVINQAISLFNDSILPPPSIDDFIIQP